MNRKVGLISYFMYCSTYIPFWYLVLESNFVLFNILCPFYLEWSSSLASAPSPRIFQTDFFSILAIWNLGVNPSFPNLFGRVTNLFSSKKSLGFRWWSCLEETHDFLWVLGHAPMTPKRPKPSKPNTRCVCALDSYKWRGEYDPVFSMRI